jgi:hypothetical protein
MGRAVIRKDKYTSTLAHPYINMHPHMHARTGADLPVLVGEVDGLHQPDRLVHVAPDRQVVDGHLF